MDKRGLHKLYHNGSFKGERMRRLCGLMLFCIGTGMSVVLVLEDSFVLVMIAIVLLIMGYHLFCGQKL